MKKLLLILLLMSSPLLADSVTLECKWIESGKSFQLMFHTDRQKVGFGHHFLKNLSGVMTHEEFYQEGPQYINWGFDSDRPYESTLGVVLDKENLIIKAYRYDAIYKHTDNGFRDRFLKSYDEDFAPEYTEGQCKKIKTISLL